MVNDAAQAEKTYGAKETAELLHIGVSTVGKYALILEDKGYRFTKSAQNARIFNEQDITALKHLKMIRENTSVKVEEAATITMDKFSPHVKQSNVTKNGEASTEDGKQYQELKEMVAQQTELINELIKRYDEQEAAHKNELAIHDKRIMELMNKSIETNRKLSQIEAAKEEKKGFWNWMVNK